MLHQPAWEGDDHRLYRDTVQKFYDAEMTPHMQAWRDQGVVDRDFWNKAGTAGILGASIPEDFGGSGLPMSFDAITLYEQARIGDSSWNFAVHNFVAHYINNYGTPEQKRRFLPGLATGERVAAIAMTEPGTGSDLQGVKTTAVADGNHYRLNGAKTFISNGQCADLICVVTKTDPRQGAKGVSLILVETQEAEGFRRGRNLKKIGMPGQDTSELFFDDCRVPQTNLLGLEEGRGFYQLMEQLPWERLAIGVTALGGSDFAIAETLNYVKDRKAFGERVMDFQNTRFKLAECKTKTEGLRTFIDEGIARLDAKALDPAYASMIKYWSTEVQCAVVDDCLQLHGGYGYMTEYPIAKAYADARVQKIYGGTNEIMKELIARALDG